MRTIDAVPNSFSYLVFDFPISTPSGLEIEDDANCECRLRREQVKTSAAESRARKDHLSLSIAIWVAVLAGHRG
jgi:hypothetical protein